MQARLGILMNALGQNVVKTARQFVAVEVGPDHPGHRAYARERDRHHGCTTVTVREREHGKMVTKTRERCD